MKKTVSNKSIRLILLLFLILIIPVALILVSTKQDIRKQASSTAHLRLSNSPISVGDTLVLTITGIPSNTFFAKESLTVNNANLEFIPGSSVIKTDAVVFYGGVQTQPKGVNETQYNLTVGAHSSSESLSGDLLEMRFRAKAPINNLSIPLTLNVYDANANRQSINEIAFLTIQNSTPSPTTASTTPPAGTNPPTTPQSTQSPSPTLVATSSPTPTPHQCFNYWTNCIPENNSCPSGQTVDSLGSCEGGKKCCKGEVRTPTPQATSTTLPATHTPQPTQTPSPTSAGNSPTPTPHQCFNYWVNCIPDTATCPPSQTQDPLGSCELGRICCK